MEMEEDDRRSRLPAKTGEGWEMVATSRGSFFIEDDFSVFPPSNHEGLLAEETPTAATEVISAAVSSPSFLLSSPSSAGNGWDARWPVRFLLQREGRRRPLVELLRRALDSGIEWFKLPSSSVKGGGIWSFGAVVGITALLLYSQLKFRREKLRLLLLVKEKDQTISLLSQHISQMNELMTSRLIVPVARNA